MNRFDDYIHDSISKEDIPMPANFHLRTQQTLDDLPMTTPVSKPRRFPRLLSAAACFFFVFFLMLPNISPVYAHAMAQVPVLGSLVEVFTFRSYEYADDTHELDAEVPNVSIPGAPDAQTLINLDAQQLTDAIVQNFYETLEEGPSAVYVDYETVTNNQDWFTLKLSINEVEASGNTRMVFYHVDRKAGTYVTLGDLFDEGGRRFLSQQILAQMEAAMAAGTDAAYFPEEVPSVLDPQQNFYFDADGNLVILFNEYEVAPGSMGNPAFTIPAASVAPYLTK